jgi:hypothetical protein
MYEIADVNFAKIIQKKIVCSLSLKEADESMYI